MNLRERNSVLVTVKGFVKASNRALHFNDEVISLSRLYMNISAVFLIGFPTINYFFAGEWGAAFIVPMIFALVFFCFGTFMYGKGVKQECDIRSLRDLFLRECFERRTESDIYAVEVLKTLLDEREFELYDRGEKKSP